MKVLDLVYLQKLHHIVEQEPVVKYITWGSSRILLNNT